MTDTTNYWRVLVSINLLQNSKLIFNIYFESYLAPHWIKDYNWTYALRIQLQVYHSNYLGNYNYSDTQKKL